MILGKVRVENEKGRWQNGRKSEEGGKGLKHLLKRIEKNRVVKVLLGLTSINLWWFHYMGPHNPAIRNWILLPLSSDALHPYLPFPFLHLPPKRICSGEHPSSCSGLDCVCCHHLSDALAWTTTLNPRRILQESWLLSYLFTAGFKWHMMSSAQPCKLSATQATFTASRFLLPQRILTYITLTLSCSPDMLAFPCLGISTHVVPLP